LVGGWKSYSSVVIVCTSVSALTQFDNNPS
jgi:hypothetical protein